ncbi:hypothetical protein E2C01_078896 [Portunus trituberculatus]|uniref:Uncharacterized protein n=1 Tax=Portunus trituberculatus TaxID=210409 RepID=A0A5B7IU50_PORTR|nr:hypothetical protein [Portunus trituberculatus]
MISVIFIITKSLDALIISLRELHLDRDVLINLSILIARGRQRTARCLVPGKSADVREGQHRDGEGTTATHASHSYPSHRRKLKQIQTVGMTVTQGTHSKQ